MISHNSILSAQDAYDVGSFPIIFIGKENWDRIDWALVLLCTLIRKVKNEYRIGSGFGKCDILQNDLDLIRPLETR